MEYLFQRLVPNDFGWERPSPGRLKDPQGKKVYLDFTGFGHEDWNFNRSFVLGGWLYGYLYYRPRIAAPSYNIAFATYDEKHGWYLAGFYRNAEYIDNGAPDLQRVLIQKAKDLRALDDQASLGKGYSGLSLKQLVNKLRDDNQYYTWRIRPEDVIRLANPAPIPDTIFKPSAYRYRRPEKIDAKVFNKLRDLRRPIKEPLWVSKSDDEDYFEGNSYLAYHKRRERSRDLVIAAKARFMRNYGKLFCEACGFDFEKRYGIRGREFIEAHHTLPVGKLKKSTAMKIEDLLMLCSNCHRMMHRKSDGFTLRKLKTILK